jgi:hypothetical protein
MLIWLLVASWLLAIELNRLVSHEQMTEEETRLKSEES